MAEQMAAAERGGASEWHFDVMDGHFVPNLSFGPHVCKGLRPYTPLPINVHLMVEEPWYYFEDFIESGATSVIIHAETGVPEELAVTLKMIRQGGAIPGIAINPLTSVEEAAQYLPLVDRVLLMSVEPGFGGQKFIPQSIERLKQLRKIANEKNPAIQIQLDGGVTLEHIKPAIEAGADILIAGNAVFGAEDIEARCRAFIREMTSSPAVGPSKVNVP
jgi:ribulose-phosphate 3-epimerase